jgi:hypothetical protein
VSTTKDPLDHARSDVQDLHKKIDTMHAKDQAALRADLQHSAEKAKQLAAELKSVVDGQRSDAKKHIKDAAAQLEDAAKHSHDLTGANEAKLKEANKAMLSKVRGAAHNLSHAVALHRANVAVK